MSRLPIRWTRPAICDLAGIRAWIAKDDPQTARRVALQIKESVDRLERLPLRGRPGRIPGTREMILPGWPWIVVYEASASQVVVLRVLRGATVSEA